MVMVEESLVTKRTSCPVCSSKKYNVRLNSKHNSPAFVDFIKCEKFYSKDYYEGYEKGSLGDMTFEVAECSNCHLFFLTEVLNDKGMWLLYNDWLDKELLRVYYSKMKYSTYEETMLRVIKKHFARKASVNVMDFGAGYGGFCAIAAGLGLNIHAFDLSADKNEHINNLGVTIINKLDKYKGFFNFIYVSQVFEHLAEPAAVIKELESCLTADGFLFISVPDCKTINNVLVNKGLSPELFEFLSPHQHVNAFTNSTLKLLASNVGLTALSMTDFLKMHNSSLNTKELIFLAKKVIKNNKFGTGLFFRKKS